MEYPLAISFLNDYIYCPLSIYFHNLNMDMDDILIKDTEQLNGSYSHKNIDNHKYSTSKDILTSISVYSSKYNLIGKIDIYNAKKQELVERKRKIHKVFDGFVYQLYAQYYGMIELGYSVRSLVLYSVEDNKSYSINLPENDIFMLKKFESLISSINDFNPFKFFPSNKKKCQKCIYKYRCDRGLI